MGEVLRPLKDFLYDNLPYLLLAAIALGLLFKDQEIAFDLGSRINVRESGGIVIGLAEQRTLALLALLFTTWKILVRPRRLPRPASAQPSKPRK